jgi:hypothetical protein
MTERVIINSRQNINVTEESVTDDDNDSDLMLSKQRTGCDDLFSDNQHQISRSCGMYYMASSFIFCLRISECESNLRLV